MNFGWSNIDFFGKNRILTNSYYIVIILPILAKLFEKISEFKIEIFSTIYVLNISLPFTWYNLYFSSLFIALGKTFYTIFCPKIIQSYSTYEEFINSGKGQITLLEYFRKSLKKLNKGVRQIVIKSFSEKYCNFKIKLSMDDIEVSKLSIFKESEGDAFWYIRNLFEDINKPFLWLSFTFYVIGSLFFTIVIIDNTITVLKAIF